MAKDEYISSNTQSWVIEATLPSGEKPIWLRTVTQTWGWASATAASERERAAASRAGRAEPVRRSQAQVNSRTVPNRRLGARRRQRPSWPRKMRRQRWPPAWFSLSLGECAHFAAMARSVWPKVVRRRSPSFRSPAAAGWSARSVRPGARRPRTSASPADWCKPSAYIEPQPEIDGPGICGMTHPFKVSALADGTVSVDKTVTIGLPDDPALEGWLADVVQPYAQARFGAERRRARGVRRLFAAARRQYRRRAAVRARVRQRDRRLRLQARRRARDQHRARLEEDRHAGIGVPARGPRRRLPALHHRARARRRRLPLQPFPSRSGDARRRPTPARAAIAGRTRRPTCMPPPGRPDGLPPAPDIEEPMDVARASAARRIAGPLDLHGPSGAAAAAGPGLRGSPAPPPILPADDGASTARRPRRSRCRTTTERASDPRAVVAPAEGEARRALGGEGGAAFAEILAERRVLDRCAKRGALLARCRARARRRCAWRRGSSVWLKRASSAA